MCLLWDAFHSLEKNYLISVDITSSFCILLSMIKCFSPRVSPSLGVFSYLLPQQPTVGTRLKVAGVGWDLLNGRVFAERRAQRRRSGKISIRTQKHSQADEERKKKKKKKWPATRFDYLDEAQQRRARRQCRQKQDGGCLQRTGATRSGDKRTERRPAAPA